MLTINTRHLVNALEGKTEGSRKVVTSKEELVKARRFYLVQGRDQLKSVSAMQAAVAYAMGLIVLAQ